MLRRPERVGPPPVALSPSVLPPLRRGTAPRVHPLRRLTASGETPVSEAALQRRRVGPPRRRGCAPPAVVLARRAAVAGRRGTCVAGARLSDGPAARTVLRR